jgi:hypothetical protein
LGAAEAALGAAPALAAVSSAMTGTGLPAAGVIAVPLWAFVDLLVIRFLGFLGAVRAFGPFGLGCCAGSGAVRVPVLFELPGSGLFSAVSAVLGQFRPFRGGAPIDLLRSPGSPNQVPWG